jgi:hypothetical protein
MEAVSMPVIMTVVVCGMIIAINIMKVLEKGTTRNNN